MKKRSILFGSLILLSLLVLNACNKVKEDETISEDNITVTVAISPTITEAIKDPEENEDDAKDREKALLELTKDYTGQMVELDFKKIIKNSTEEVKKQISEEYLKTLWKSTVKPLGEYVGIMSQELEAGDGFVIIKTIMEFDENGLLLTINYNSEDQIQGLWFTYQSIEEEVKSDKYEEVEIAIGKEEITLEGKLTLPIDTQNPPVVILVQGSGQSDLDETIGAVSNKPFRDIANGLAEQGIATIRYNKRFYQYADKAGINFTIYDEVLDDVSAAIDFALADSRVDGSKIYIVGHSLGGMLAPKIASDNKEVVGFISLAGSPRNLEDIILDQVKNAMDIQANLSEEEKTYALSQYDEAIQRIKNLGNDNLGEAILGATGYYWRSLNEIDTKSLVSELTIPMLFLQGGADFQVFPEIDFAEWKNILEGNKNASFVLYDDLNHLFMKTNGLSDVTEYDIKANVDKKVIEDIAEWILIRQ